MPYRDAFRFGRWLILLSAGAAACSSDNLSAPGTNGTLEVTTATTGTEMDPDGYTVQVDGQPAGAIGTAGTIHSDLAAGDHSVQLMGLAANCNVTGENPRTVSLTAGQTQTVAFEVTCGPTSGGLQVTASTTGPAPDADGYSVTVDGAEQGTVAASGTVSLAGVTGGQHEIGLSGVAGNCTVSGDNPQTVTVVPGASATVAFTVTCSAPPANVGSVRITTVTTGTNPDPNGYQVAVDGGAAQPIGVNASTTVSSVAAGAHQVALTGLASNCTVQGGNTKQVTVAVGASAAAAFAVNCSTSGGSSWAPMMSGTTTFLEHVSGSSATNVFAAGENLGCNTSNCGMMTLLHYDGTRWSTQLTHAGGVRDVWAAPNGEAFALAEGPFPGQILHYDGQQWSSPAAQPAPPPPQEDQLLDAIWGTSASDVFAVGTYFTSDAVAEDFIVHFDGAQWSRMKVAGGDYLRLSDVWGSSPTDVYATALYKPYDSEITDYRAVILHYNGQVWSEVLREPNLAFGHIWGTSATDVYATGSSGSNGAIWHYDGHAWSPMSIPATRTLTAVWASSPRDVYVLTGPSGPSRAPGNFWHFDGTTWTEVKTKSSGLMDVWGSSASDVFVVGADGTILHGP